MFSRFAPNILRGVRIEYQSAPVFLNKKKSSTYTSKIVASSIYDIIPLKKLLIYLDNDSIKKNDLFGVALYLYARLYNLEYLSVPLALASKANLVNGKAAYLKHFNRIVKDEDSFNRLSDLYAKLDIENRQHVNTVYKKFRVILKSYTDSIDPIFKSKKGTLSPYYERIGFQPENPRYKR